MTSLDKRKYISNYVLTTTPWWRSTVRCQGSCRHSDDPILVLHIDWMISMSMNGFGSHQTFFDLIDWFAPRNPSFFIAANGLYNALQATGYFRVVWIIKEPSGHQAPGHQGNWKRWWHYCDVIMGAIASQITSLTIVYSTVYSDADQRKKSKLRVTGLCAGNSPVTGEFPAQMASNAENVSILMTSSWSRLLHGLDLYRLGLWTVETLYWSSCFFTCLFVTSHYSDVITNAMASQIAGVSIVCSPVCWGAD